MEITSSEQREREDELPRRKGQLRSSLLNINNGLSLSPHLVARRF